MPQFKDQSLVPQGAVRLCTLGLLMERDRPFGELAVEVRRFVSRMLGPSLDILGDDERPAPDPKRGESQATPPPRQDD